MKTSIKIENNFSYQVNLDEDESFVMINGVLITKQVLSELEYIQGVDQKDRDSNLNYYALCESYANLFSYLIEAGDHIDRPAEHSRVMNFVQLQFSTLRAMNPNRWTAERLINAGNGITPKEYLPSSEETLMGHFKADAS